MKKNYFIAIFTFLCFSIPEAQNLSGLWEGHFSYLNVKDVVTNNEKIYAASENAVFIYDISTQELREVSTIDGLSGELISTIHYSEDQNVLVIGYENGLIEVYNELTGEISTVVDILDKQTIPPDSKRINHFSEYNGSVYIAADFGVSVYDLSRLEFGDTYYIGSNGSQIQISQTTIFGDYIYVSCGNNEGIKRGLLSSPNLIDYQQWEQVTTGNYVGIEAVEDNLFCVSASRNVYQINDTTLTQILTYPNDVLDFKSYNSNLIVTIENNVFVYDNQFNLISNPTVTPEFNTKFTASVTTDEGIYIGTENFGVLKTTVDNKSEFVEIHPDGPLRNNTFSIESGYGSLWATYGDYTTYYNPAPGRRYGLSHLNNGSWNNIPFESVFNATNLNTISINPLNPNQVFISSFQWGILEIVDDVPVMRHDHTNSGLESLILTSAPNYVSIRVSGAEFDQNGVLWSITSLVDRPLKSYDPSSNQWRSYDFTPLIPDGFDNQGFNEIEVTDSGIIYVASFHFGVIGFNPSNQELKSLMDEGENTLGNSIRALAMDNRGQLWIGTDLGLRVLYNTSGFFTDDNLSAEPIIILDNGIPRELLEEQYIADIKVDGSNNKWIATIGAGLYYLSSDGQQTIYHFTKDNSPLPSNNVNEVSIDDAQGIIYIATDKGLVSFRSGGSAPNEELVEAYIYPNPVRPGFNINTEKIKVKGITDNVNIKITDIEGNLVAEAQSRTNLRYRGYNLEIDGGTVYWNGKNMANNNVASGVYLVMISDLESLETKVLKLMIVR